MTAQSPALRALSLSLLIFSTTLSAFALEAAIPASADIQTGEACLWENDDDWQGEFFPGIPEIKYEGPTSRNVFAYKYYNAEEGIAGRPMKDWLRLSVAFWHTFRGDGGDPFGSPTKAWPWEDSSKGALAMAFRRMRSNFELLRKLGLELWCFHDRDIAPEGATLRESNANLDKVVELVKKLQEGTNIHPLWGTAQLFKHPRYMHGAATSPDAAVFAYAAAQVKKAMEVTVELGGENFVFWGGREGYQSLLNTDLKQELDHQASFLRLAADYKKKLGFNGTLLLEPKPQEPTKHQYDWDAATTAGFLLRYGLEGEYKLNIECNHATLSGHSCHHELEVARIVGLLGNIDANTGDAQTGWDTDQFLTDPAEATLVMLSVLRNGGLAPGGINFDAKLRRESVDVEDLVIGHVGAIDALARGLRSAVALLEDGALPQLVKERYSSFGSGIGAAIHSGATSFEELAAAVEAAPEPARTSAKQELAEQLFLRHV
eukprot:TRINITY_DN249_c0_g1_i1.p1 TRINITY_DN249_c0_g1~~TRINITY_DN249_c0_g1_i1.p1  ORF type:complete len:489 (-),score=103.78 TRINITY_DN249_c0_g1_i1:1643-3109(-)